MHNLPYIKWLLSGIALLLMLNYGIPTPPIILVDRLLPPFSYGHLGDFYVLGTDDMGRSLAYALLSGLSLSLSLGLTTGFVAFMIGTSYGMISAYKGGLWDEICMRIVDIFLSLPTLIIAMICVTLLGKSWMNMALTLIIVQWAFFARMARSATLQEKNKDYVTTAKSLRLPSYLILFVDILPNILPALLVVLCSQMAGGITLESTLSFLGLGLTSETTSLGLLIDRGIDLLFVGYYWISLFPGLILLGLIYILNFYAHYWRTQ